MPVIKRSEPNCMRGIVNRLPAPGARSTLESDRIDDRRRKVYNTHMWQRLRQARLAEHPLCEICLQAGRYRPAGHVHHLKSFNSGGLDPAARQTLAFRPDNLCSICDECHGLYHMICETEGMKVDHTPEEIYRIIDRFCAENERTAPWDRPL